MKNPASIIGDGDAIIIPAICRDPEEQVDYEGELALIIGCDCRDVDESEALKVISGFAVANDVSARWWQKHGSGGQFVRGKSFDTFCPLSDPVSPERVGDPQNLELTTKLNGEIVQHANTSDMFFSVKRLISELSRATTLIAGTIILTGTPAGVGAAQNPPRLLRQGDVVEVSIERVGTLRNPVGSETT